MTPGAATAHFRVVVSAVIGPAITTSAARPPSVTRLAIRTVPVSLMVRPPPASG
jgi:hypothetical protein